MEKKILIILLCGLLAVWPCIPALATEEETTAEWNIFEDVETVARQTVTSIEQGTEIISKYIAMTTDYTGNIFDNLVNEAVDLWQSSGVALTLDYVTNGGALDYIVDIGELGALISEYINSTYGTDDSSGYVVQIGGGSWLVVAPHSTYRNGSAYVTNNGDYPLYCTGTPNNASVYASFGVIGIHFYYAQFFDYNWTINTPYMSGYYKSHGGQSRGVYGAFGVSYPSGTSTTTMLNDLFGGDIPERESATSTPTQYITSAGIGSVNWSNVSSDESNTYNNIENVYNYITNTGQQLDEASVDQMAAEGATLANIDYSVPNASYDYSFISVAFACLPDEFKGIILLGIVLLVCSILFGFGHGGVK